MNRDKAFVFFSVLSKVGLGGVLFFIPISKALISSFIGIALIGFIGKKIIKPDFQWLKNKQNIVLALFFFFMGLSLINSGQYINKSFVALFLKWGKFIVLSLILQDAVSKRKDILLFVGIFLFSAALTAFSGVTQFFCGLEFLRGRDVITMGNDVKHITSSFNHYNGFGGYLIIPFVLCIAFMQSPGFFKKKANYFILFLGIILIFCIFNTFSRGTWVGVIISLILMSFISRRLNILLTLSIILTGILLFSVFRSRFLLIFELGGDRNRFEIWQAAITMFKENPFLGKGLGTFMSHTREYLPLKTVSYAHNCFLQILAESGIFSLISFLGFLGLVFYAGIKKFLSTEDPILLGGVCGLAGFLVHSLFDVNLYSLPLAVLFWMWAGIIVVLSSDRLT